MKNRLLKKSLVSLAIVIIVFSNSVIGVDTIGRNSLLSKTYTDIFKSNTANASEQITKYTFEVLSTTTDQSRKSEFSTVKFWSGDIINVEINTNNNQFTTIPGWGVKKSSLFGNIAYGPAENHFGVLFNEFPRYMRSLGYPGTAYEAILNYDTYTLNGEGIRYFESLSVGDKINFVQLAIEDMHLPYFNYEQASIQPNFTGIMVVNLKSKVTTSINACEGEVTEPVTKYTFEVLSTTTDPSRKSEFSTVKFWSGDIINVEINTNNNQFTTIPGWGVQKSSLFGHIAYGAAGNHFGLLFNEFPRYVRSLGYPGTTYEAILNYDTYTLNGEGIRYFESLSVGDRTNFVQLAIEDMHLPYFNYEQASIQPNFTGIMVVNLKSKVTTPGGQCIQPPAPSVPSPPVYVDKFTDVNLGIDFDKILDYLNDKGLGDHNTNSNTSMTVNTGNGNNSVTGIQIGEFNSNYVKFTNIPDSGKILTSTKSWRPEFIVSHQGGIMQVPKSQDTSKAGQYDKTLSKFLTPKGEASKVEVILYRVISMDELANLTKTQDSLKSMFDTDSSGNYTKSGNITYTSLSEKGLVNYDKFNANQQGVYLLATKYYDGNKSGSKDDKTHYTYTPIEVSMTSDLGYLPIKNNPKVTINDLFVSLGSNKGNHNMTNLKYKNSEKSYESLKDVSVYNYKTGKTLIASPNGGFKLLNNKMKNVTITTTVDIDNLKVTGASEYDGGFILSSDKGIYYLDSQTNTILSTVINTPVSDIKVHNDIVYSLSEKELKVYFLVDNKLVESFNVYDLTSVFSKSGKKAGRMEIIGDYILVSTKDEGVNSESAILFKE